MTSVQTVAGGLSPPIVEGGARLADRLPRSYEGAQRGWPPVAATMASLAIGVMVVAMWVDEIRLLVAMLPIAVLAAGAVSVHAVHRVRQDMKMRRLRAAHPKEPWRWDHTWDERGTRDDTASDAAHATAAGVVLAVAAVPANTISVSALVGGDTLRWVLAVPFVAVALALDVMAACLFVSGARLTARRLRYGGGIALFEGFPFRRGDRLRLHVEAPRALPRHALVTATLRCVQERHVTPDTADDSPTLRCFEVYRDSAPAERFDAGSGVRALRLTFRIPSDVPASDLASSPCRYWEVDVEAGTDGVEYAARFLVPVY